MEESRHMGYRLVALIWVVLALNCTAGAQELYRTIQTPGLTIRYMNDIEELEARNAADFLQTEYESIVKELGFSPKDRIEVRIYDTVGRFLTESGLKKPWRGALYSRNVLHSQPIQALITRGIYEKSLSYELSRAVLNTAREKGCPVWLSEAYVSYRSGGFREMSAPVGARLSSFSDLTQDFQQHQDPPQRDDVQYMLAQTMNFFVIRYGEAKAIGLFKEFDGSRSVGAVFAEYLGSGYETVEKEWATYIATHSKSFKR